MRFQIDLSAPLVAEYEAVLKRGLLTLTAQQIDDVPDYLCAEGIHHKIFYLWRPVLKDPDDFPLELAKDIANEDHVSMNQFIASAVAEKISALNTEKYLSERAQRASEEKFRAALAAVPDQEPEAFDRP